MMTKTLVATATVLLLILGGTIVGFHNHNRNLRRQLAELTGPTKRTLQLREENKQLKRLVEKTKTSRSTADQVMAEEMSQARSELEALRRKREKLANEAVAGADALALNRDPEKGPVRIENFQNIGRETPSSAFQTLIWAAVNGEDDILAASVLIPGGARSRLEELLAGLSEEARAKYQNPEKLVSVFIAADIFKGPAAEITAQTKENSERVILNVRASDKSRDMQMPMQRTTSGWRLAISDAQVHKLIARLRDSGAR